MPGPEAGPPIRPPRVAPPHGSTGASLEYWVRSLFALLAATPATGNPGAASLSRRFRTGVAWNLVGTTSNQGSTLLVNILLANVLGQYAFGRYAIVLSTVQTTSMMAGLAMGYTATKYLAEFRVADPPRASRVLAFCSALSAGMAIAAGFGLFLAAPVLAREVFGSPTMAPLLRISGGVCLFMTINGFMMGALAGLESYRVLGGVGIASGLLYVVVEVGFARLWGTEGAVGGLLLSAGIQSILLKYFLNRSAAIIGLRADYRHMARERRILLHFALPGALAGLTTAPALWSSQAILARQPDGFAALAIYIAAFNLMGIVLFLPSVANGVGMSLINSARGQGDAGQYRRVFWANLRVTLLVLAGGAAGLLLLGRYGLAAYGTSFLPGTTVLWILLVGVVPESITMALYQVVQSREKMWYGMSHVVLPRDLSMPALGVFLVPALGAEGLALAYTGSRIIGLFATIIAVTRLGLSPAPATALDPS
jgi:O-antigen/teichoic acid export membrane protein